MQDRAATTELRRTLASLPEVLDDTSRTRIEECVHAFVDVAREEGWPVERIIVAVKAIAADAGLRSSTDVLRTKTMLRRRDEVLLDVVRWCVERYFGYSRQQA